VALVEKRDPAHRPRGLVATLCDRFTRSAFRMDDSLINTILDRPPRALAAYDGR
jgi:hypothetical protein